MLVRSLAVCCIIAAVFASIGACTPSLSSQPDDSQLDSRSCGTERWAVKTGTDPDAPKVNLVPVDSTVATLTSFPLPKSAPMNGRVPPQELTVYRLSQVTLVEFMEEADQDYHLVLSDGSRTMIAEIPSPNCVSTGPFASTIRKVRATFDAQYTVSTSTMKTVNEPVTIMGVGFFDKIHGQTGVAPNGIELHPVLGICFGSGCTVGGSAAHACVAGFTDCGSGCVDTSSDSSNCGTCGVACTGGTACAGGHCVTPPSTCPAWQTPCGAACVPTATDTSNCGSCGNVCPNGDSCTNGNCVSPPPIASFTTGCSAGLTPCGGLCVDTTSDTANCGACGNQCPLDNDCEGGTCTYTKTITCPSYETVCGKTCADLWYDPNNCGACGNACPDGSVCYLGVCNQCADALTPCNGNCVDVTSDPSNCGACGNQCQAWQTCVSGACN